MDAKRKISVIMPAYNEGRIIANNIRETEETFREFGVDFQIIVVDDGSSDETFIQAKECASKYNNITVVRNASNLGKGHALKVGFSYAKGDYVVFLDADIDIHPVQVKTFFDLMELDNVDVVIGSKRHPNSKLQYPLHRRIVSSVYFFLVKILFGLPIHDTQTGLKLFKYEVLKQIFPRILVKRFAYDLEILLCSHFLNYKITEAPVILRPQIGTMPPVDFRAIWTTWFDTMAIWYRAFILRYYEGFHNHTYKIT